MGGQLAGPAVRSLSQKKIGDTNRLAPGSCQPCVRLITRPGPGCPAARHTSPKHAHTSGLIHFCLSRRKPPCVTPDPPGPPSNAYAVISPPSNADAVGWWTTARILHSPAYSYAPRADTSALTAHFSTQTATIRAAKSSLSFAEILKHATHGMQHRQEKLPVRSDLIPYAYFARPLRLSFTQAQLRPWSIKSPILSR